MKPPVACSLLRMEAVESTALCEVGYRPETQELYVRFLESGEVYVYSDVRSSVFDALCEAQSKGQFYSLNIRNNFPYRRCA